MITQNLQLKVIDLGYAKELKGIYGSGLLYTRLGTPTFRAPEIEYEGFKNETTGLVYS